MRVASRDGPAASDVCALSRPTHDRVASHSALLGRLRTWVTSGWSLRVHWRRRSSGLARGLKERPTAPSSRCLRLSFTQDRASQRALSLLERQRRQTLRSSPSLKMLSPCLRSFWARSARHGLERPTCRRQTTKLWRFDSSCVISIWAFP